MVALVNSRSRTLGLTEAFFNAVESALDDFHAREMEHSMKVTAKTQVTLLSTVLAPRPPKTLDPEPPPPKAAPIPPPLPAWSRTMMINKKQTMMCKILITLKIHMGPPGMSIRPGGIALADWVEDVLIPTTHYASSAALAMATKSSTLSEAPPTRAPSISGCESRAAALLGLTLPPY